jgi:4-diphosphocytidyl-2-C-methyl-D-erythritol kinase
LVFVTNINCLKLVEKPKNNSVRIIFKSLWYFYIKIQEMVIFPRAKINIGLYITGRRTDGYHNLETIFYPVGLCDAVEFVAPPEPIEDDVLDITGNFTDSVTADNLVLKAVRRIRKVKNIPFLKIHLHKAIPAGAGLGGGSSDAATMLRSLNRHFNIGITPEDLRIISLELGSDCPFFIDSCPAFGEGRGEILTLVPPIPEQYHILLANPGIHVSTKEAYSLCNPRKPGTNLIDLYNLGIPEWKNRIFNDFEEPVFRKYPGIALLKRTLYEMGALYSSMSGSGSTVYGIFSAKPDIPLSIKDQVIYSDYL